MKKRIALLPILLVTFLASAQDEGFIYGKVYMIDDRTYEGPIRWGKEEVFWTDVFNAGKEENRNLRYLNSRERDALDERQHQYEVWASSGNWNRWFGNWSDDRDRDNDYTHQFACPFGAMKSLEPIGRKAAEITLQSGKRVIVSGEGYNDMGTEIKIMDPDMGEVELSWSRIRKIEFMKSPKAIENRFGKPLYGTVESSAGTFTGLIQWDHDERLSTDKLDGDTDDGDIALEFGKIKSIERKGWYSQVVLKSGREMRMDGSNDVDDSNRGIIVTTKEMTIDIPWREFDKVTFSEPSVVATYDQFASQGELNATVTTRDGKKLSGRLVFDLDEEFDFELLQGNQNEVEVEVTFKSIKNIKPGRYRCEVELKSGKRLVLEDAHDVDDKNQGLLVFTDKADPVYVLWENVELIELK